MIRQPLLSELDPTGMNMTTRLRNTMLLTGLLMLCGAASLASQSGISYNVRDFGAVGDGVTLDTKALQSAIDRCASQGGTVFVPAGNFLTGSIDLKSNVDLYIAAGAVILGSKDLKDYAEHVPAFRSYNDVFLKYSLFYAERAENISIRGEGAIDGQGGAFKVTTTVRPDRYMNRPYLLRFVGCTSVRIQGITMRNSAMWMQHYLGCDNLIIHGIRVYNHANKNNDMMDIDGCKNVVISDCIGDTDDDAITLKSTSPLMTENVTITNCILSSHCNAIKCGTESTGGFRNITVSNIVVKPSMADTVLSGHAAGISGITLAVVDGGIMEGITIGNITIDGPRVPVYVRLGNRARKYTPSAPVPPAGVVRNISVHDLIVSNAGAIGCSVSGIPGHPVENVRLSNIRVTYAGGGTAADAEKEMPELEDIYPESTAWDKLPAYGLYVRHARGISVVDWTLDCKTRDMRPVVRLVDVENGIVDGLRADVDSLSEAFITVEDSRAITIRHSAPASRTETFLQVRGSRSRDIFLHGNLFRNVTKDFTAERGVGVVSEGNFR